MDTATHPRLDEFLAAYIDCALWSSMDNADDSGGNPLDDNYSRNDIAPETIEAMKADCLSFLESLSEHFPGYSFDDIGRAGHDFWLNRNGHGSGFWDGDYEFNGEDISDRLSDLAKTYGEFDLYIGDDGKVYGA